MTIGNASLLAGLAAVSLWAAAARAQSQSQAVLTVQINAAAYFEPPSGMQWRASGDAQTLSIPLNVLLRLNQETNGLLTISALDSGTAGSLLIETEAGFVPTAAQVPIVIRRYARSGVHPTLLTLRLASPAAGPHDATLLSIRLSSSDGAASWAQTVTIPPAPPAASEPMLSAL